MNIIKDVKPILFEGIALLDIKNNKLAFTFGCLALSPLFGFLPSFTTLYRLFMIGICLRFISHSRKFDRTCVFLLIACCISILLASPATIFKPWFRYGVFVLLFVIISPLIKENKFIKFRSKLLQLSLFISVIVSVVSFIFYFLGINYMVYNESSDYLGSAGRFGGLTSHSMLLGPVSAVSTIYCSYRALSTKNKLYWLLCISSFACTLFSSSRSAFLCAVLGVISMLYTNASNKRNFFKRIFLIGVICSITFPLWSGALSGLEEKQQRNVDRGNTFSSRESKWDNRLDEFNDSPIWGVGFCACDPKHVDDYMPSTGIIETGSSWLAVLSMTGILGFIPFGIIIYKSVKRVWSKRRTNIEASLYLGLIVFLSIHMLVEGYIFAGGSVLCFIAWLIISCCYEIEIEK